MYKDSEITKIVEVAVASAKKEQAIWLAEPEMIRGKVMEQLNQNPAVKAIVGDTNLTWQDVLESRILQGVFIMFLRVLIGVTEVSVHIKDEITARVKAELTAMLEEIQ